MAETLVRFTEAIAGRDGREYIASARGQPGGDGLWHGWLEFTDGTKTVITSQESEQPNRDDLMYWAQGLTHVYLQGALERALRSRAETGTGMARPVAPNIEPAAVLDPFAVYRQGESVLRRQLLALSRSQLNAVIRQYDLGPPVPAEPRGTAGYADAVDRIVLRVRAANAPRTSFGPVDNELR